MNISVIIPTYNGAHKIINLLQALEKQSIKNFEVIVVIDGSTDNTVKLLEQTTFDRLTIKIIQQQNSGRAISRNTGAENAQGELLVFFDDDMRPENACIEKHLKHHTKYSGSICVGTQIDDYKKANSDIQRYKCYLSRKWQKKVNFTEVPLNKDNLYITAANFSITKNLFEQLGGFDKRLKDGEDYELSVRAFIADIPIYFNQEAFAWHDDLITCRTYIKRQREYAIWDKQIILLQDGLREGFKRLETKKNSLFKKIIFRAFSHKIWVWFIDNSTVLLILPKKIRYKIYDLVITGLSRHFMHINID